MVIEDFSFDAPKTKQFVEMTKNLKVSDKKSLFVLPEANNNVFLSARNLQRNELAIASDINTYQVLNADVMVVTENALNVIEGVLTNKVEA